MDYSKPNDFRSFGESKTDQDLAQPKSIQEIEAETRQIQEAREARRLREITKRDNEKRQQQAEAKAAKEQPTSTLEDFKGGLQHLQVRLPSDLCKSLKLASIQEERSISDIVLDCLTSQNMMAKKWIHTKGGADAA